MFWINEIQIDISHIVFLNFVKRIYLWVIIWDVWLETDLG